MISTTITPIELDGRYWVRTTIDGHELQQRGPYPGIDVAEVAARQIAGVCQTIFHSGVVVAPARSRQGARYG